MSVRVADGRVVDPDGLEVNAVLRCDMRAEQDIAVADGCEHTCRPNG